MPDVTITLRTIDKSTPVVQKAQTSFQKLGSAFNGVKSAALPLIAVGAGLIKFMSSASNQAAESARTQAKLEAVLRSTGEAAGLNSKELNSMAKELEKVNAIDADLITNAQAVMLTFTKIGSDVFPRATQAAIDMSAVLGSDLQGSIIQVSKALNDFSGYTALSRAGVSFSEEQKNQISLFKETNNLAGYQKLILDELAIEFEGTAKAMADASNGSERLAIAWGNFMEAAGDSAWWTDFQRGVTYTIDATTEWISTTKEANIVAADTQTSFEDYAASIGMTGPELDKLGKGMERFKNEMERGKALTALHTKEVDNNSGALDNNSVSLEENADASEAAAQSNSNFLSLLDNMQSRTEDFTEKNDELMEKFHELRDAQSEYTAGSDEYNELGEQINEVSGEIGELGSAYEAAGKKIAFELVTMKAASDGWQAGEFENLLALGEQWGIYDASVVAAATAMETSAKKMADSLGAPIDKVETMLGKIRHLELLNGLAFDFYVNIHTKGGIPAALGDVGLGGDAPVVYTNPDSGNETSSGSGITAQASGGKLGKGWTLVGDMPGGRLAAYSELIGPDGTVYNAKDTRTLMASGQLGSVRSMAEPNESGGSGSVTIPYVPSSPGGAGGGHGGGNNVGNNSPSSISSIVSQLESGQQETQQEVAGLSSAIQLQAQQTAQLLNMTTQMNGYLSTLVSLAKTNPRAVGKNVAFEFAKST